MVVTISVTAARLKPRLLVVHSGGDRQIVVGGRLVSETVAGVTKRHPDMPSYTEGMFPVPFARYEEGSTDVVVTAGKRRVGPVRAATLLFNALDPETIRSWIRSAASREEHHEVPEQVG